MGQGRCIGELFFKGKFIGNGECVIKVGFPVPKNAMISGEDSFYYIDRDFNVGKLKQQIGFAGLNDCGYGYMRRLFTNGRRSVRLRLTIVGRKTPEFIEVPIDHVKFYQHLWKGYPCLGIDLGDIPIGTAPDIGYCCMASDQSL
ncbi:hypothetical protein GCM10023184_40000 [Flaviaesturariibacter amylovorans]|uniref:Uncharacterized protein n=2 Tax=Flaviaesturariibacter amylovorans TaxID=1084520 RepID=A0ABP8HN32_9BACT